MRSLILSIARACFVMCKGCYNHFSWDEKLVSQEALLKFLWKLKQKTGLEKLTFSWWDPLSRSDIIDLLYGAQKLWFTHISVDTVGIPLLVQSQTCFRWKENIERIDVKKFVKYVSYLGLPLDWVSNAMVEKFRAGRPNLFDETLELLSSLVDTGVKVNINTVVTRHNYQALVTLYSILLKYPNIVRWQLFQYIPTHWLDSIIDREFYLSNNEFENAIWRIKKDSYSSILVQPKSILQRNNQYLLIDHAWFARVPDPDNFHKKKIVGNICREKDLDCIVAQFLSDEIL